MYLGSSPASAPYVVSSKVSTVFYFVYLLLLVPGLNLLSHKLLRVASDLEGARKGSTGLAPALKKKQLGRNLQASALKLNNQNSLVAPNIEHGAPAGTQPRTTLCPLLGKNLILENRGGGRQL